MHVDDLADAAVFLMRNYDEGDIINIGTGTDVTIRELAGLIAEVNWSNMHADSITMTVAQLK